MLPGQLNAQGQGQGQTGEESGTTSRSHTTDTITALHAAPGGSSSTSLLAAPHASSSSASSSEFVAVPISHAALAAAAEVMQVTVQSSWDGDTIKHKQREAEESHKKGEGVPSPSGKSVDFSTLPKRPRFGRLSTAAYRQDSESAGGALDVYVRASGSNVIKQLGAMREVRNHWLVRFDVRIFIEFFFIHVFGPLSVPFIYHRYGRDTCIADNLQLTNKSVPSIVSNIVWGMSCVMWILWFLLPLDIQQVIPFGEVLMAFLLQQARNTIIAAKYAYFSPGQLHDLHTRVFTVKEVSQSLMISGWSVISPTLISSELDHAIQRQHVDVKHCYLNFADEDPTVRKAIARQLHDALDAESVGEKWRPEWTARLDEGEVPSYLYLLSILQESVKEERFPRFPLIAAVLSLIHCLIPTVMRLNNYGVATSMALSAQEGVIIASAFFVTFPNVWGNIMFVLIGVVDYYRRIYCMHCCSGMVSHTYKHFQTGRSRALPIIDFERASNIAAWIDMRMVLKDFGLQYFHRIQAYASFWFFFVLCFIVYLFVSLLTGTANNITVVLVLFDLVVVVVTLLAMITAAMQLNHQHVEHKLVLVHKCGELQRQLTHAVAFDACDEPLDLSPEKLKQLEHARAMLTTAMQILEEEDRIRPVKILGFQANDSLLKALLSIAGSAAIAAAKLLFPNF